MIRDRDRIYGTIVTRRLCAMGIRDKPIAPASSWQNGFAERRRIYAGFCDPTHAITTTSERIGHWTKMCRFLARFSGQEASNRSPSSADSISTMPGFRFSVHTGRRLKPCLFPHPFPPLELFEHRLDRVPKRRASALFMVDGRRRLYSADRI